MHMQLPRNMTLNRQRNDRPMIKIYKDLMVTKRDLIDLRESITKTIKSIKEADKGSKEPRGRCSQCGERLNPAEGHECKQTVSCELCLMQFQGVERLNQHRREVHRTCPHCHLTHTNSIEEHQTHNCPEKTTFCQFCAFSVKKKEMNQHFKICGFRECHVCKKDIYAKTFTFHLQECSKRAKRSLLTPCKQLPRTKAPRPLVLPCCLILEDYLE